MSSDLHMLFDFEKEEDAKLWTKNSNAWHWMEMSDQYATSGAHSIRYQAKKFPERGNPLPRNREW